MSGHDQDPQEKLRALKDVIQEGLDGEPSDKTVSQIIEAVEARLKSDGRLPSLRERLLSACL